MTENTNVTVIGAGNMGTALVKALLDKSFKVTVWNRKDANVDNLEVLASLGATIAETVPEAINASDVIMVSILDYAATNGLLQDPEVDGLLKGKTLIQLSSGMPDEARASAEWAKENSILYLDGVVLSTPEQAGSDEFAHIYSGDSATFENCKSSLEGLGGTPVYLGEAAGLAAALDIGLLSFWFSTWTGYIHGAALCEAEGVPIDSFLSIAAPSLQALSLPMITDMSEMIKNKEYPPIANLNAYIASMEHIIHISKDNGIDSGVMDGIANLVRMAIAKGHGEDDLSAIIEVMRKKA